MWIKIHNIYSISPKIKYTLGRWGGKVVSTIAAQQEGAGFESRAFLGGVCTLSQCLRGFSADLSRV